MNKTIKVLLIEDNVDIAGQLTTFFQGLSWQVDYARTGSSGLQFAKDTIYDVVILDLNLPDIDGVQVCEAIRASAAAQLPILMLTARDTFEDKAVGYESGADDYVTKPFEFRELALKCQALARRKNLHKPNLIEIAELNIDLIRRQAVRKGQDLKLTKIGFDILVVLAQAYPEAVTRSSLEHQLWGEDVPESDVLRSHIYSLRNTLDKPYKFQMLKTMINVGYRLVTEDEI